jgi:hypothetical protein
MSQPSLDSVALELARMHESIRETYSGDCLARARRLASLLAAHGHSPVILKLSRVVTDGEQTRHDPLIPLHYRGRGGPTWTSHFVCVLDDVTYDPLLGTPTPLEGYSLKVFGEEFPSTVWHRLAVL